MSSQEWVRKAQARAKGWLEMEQSRQGTAHGCCCAHQRHGGPWSRDRAGEKDRSEARRPRPSRGGWRPVTYRPGLPRSSEKPASPSAPQQLSLSLPHLAGEESETQRGVGRCEFIGQPGGVASHRVGLQREGEYGVSGTCCVPGSQPGLLHTASPLETWGGYPHVHTRNLRFR